MCVFGVKISPFLERERERLGRKGFCLGEVGDVWKDGVLKGRVCDFTKLSFCVHVTCLIRFFG